MDIKKKEDLQVFGLVSPLTVLERRSVQIIRCCLIDIIIEPVGEQKVSMASPVEQWTLGHVVVGEVVLRDGGIQALFHVAEIFVGNGFAIIFQMTGDKELPAVVPGDQVYACGIGHRENLELGMGQDILAVHFGVAAVRSKKFIVKPAYQRVRGCKQLMPENAGELLRKLIFRNAEVVI